MPPILVEVEHTVGHPVETVFSFMADPVNRPRWQERTQSVEMLSEGPAAVGTRWRESTKGVGTYEAAVVGFEHGRLWVEEADTGKGRGRITVAFAPDGAAATHLKVTVEVLPGGPAPLARDPPLARPAVLARSVAGHRLPPDVVPWGLL